MKKRSVQLIFILLITVLLVASVSASIKSNKVTYNTKESVVVLSTVGINDNLCRSQNPPENVKIYIVGHRESWSDEDGFEDVRGEPSEIPNSRFSNTKIWDNPRVGKYDLIVDCNENKIYDEASEPIYNVGFEVIPKKGIGTMSKGFRSPQDFTWQYDPENPKLSIPIYQLKLSAQDEDLKLVEINLDIKTPLEITNIEIYFDKNNNGIVDSEDELLTKKEDARKDEIINLDFIVRQDIEENLLIVFNNNEDSPNGKYSVKIVSLTSVGESSEKEIRFIGNPLESKSMTIIDKKTCIGEIVLALEPNPAFLNEKTTAKISGLSGCNDKKIILKSNSCFVATGDLDECILEANLCEMSIDAVKGQYFACVDKDDDGNYNGFGESVSIDLEIKEEPKEIATEESVELGEVDDDEEPVKITGSVIGNLGDLEINNNLLIVLEITLLIILVFLVLIFYRILKPKTTELGKEEKENDSDLFEDLGEEKKEEKTETDSKEDDIFEEIEEKRREITDKVDKDIKDSKKKKK